MRTHHRPHFLSRIAVGLVLMVIILAVMTLVPIIPEAWRAPVAAGLAVAGIGVLIYFVKTRRG